VGCGDGVALNGSEKKRWRRQATTLLHMTIEVVGIDLYPNK
jgi:hypothetical protein